MNIYLKNYKFNYNDVEKEESFSENLIKYLVNILFTKKPDYSLVIPKYYFSENVRQEAAKIANIDFFPSYNYKKKVKEAIKKEICKEHVKDIMEYDNVSYEGDNKKGVFPLSYGKKYSYEIYNYLEQENSIFTKLCSATMKQKIRKQFEKAAKKNSSENNDKSKFI